MLMLGVLVYQASTYRVTIDENSCACLCFSVQDFEQRTAREKKIAVG